MLEKKCLICKEIKAVSEFNKCKSKSLGFQNECRSCGNGKAKRWRDENSEWVKERRRIHYSKNKERLRNAIYKGRKLRPENYKKIAKKSYDSNREDRLKEKKEYYIKNRQKILKKVQKYQKENSYPVIYRQLKWGSKNRGLGPLLITYDEFVDFRENNKKCFYCPNDLPEVGSGMDRIDNSKGYLLDNIVPCCTSCNKIRGNNLTHEEMVVAMNAVNTFRKL